MGIVYCAVDLKLNREVAVKVLPPELVADPDRRRRFVQEAQAAAALNHPHIAVVHEIDEADGVTFMAMELIGGEKLSEVLARGPLPVTRSLELVLEAAEGLARAHDRGIVHRDVKPANLIVTEDGHIKIIDFGLAKLFEPLREQPSEAQTAVRGATDAGVVMGTVSYMSPEQARGDHVDHRTDVWSLGVVLFEMLTGRAPFQGASPTDTLSEILRDSAPRLPLAGQEEIQRIADECLAKDRNHRYQGMRDLAADLRAARFRLESGALAPGVSKTGRKRWPFAAAIAVLVIGGLYFSGLWTRRSMELPTNEPTGVAVRRSVAVVGFKNLSGNADAAWLSTALTEMFTSELAAGERLRTIPGENVGRMKIELRLADAESFGAETLARIRANLGCDLVVLGSYLALGESGGGKIRLDLRLQDAQMGETVAAVSDAGKEEDLLDLVSRTGARLRERLGVGELSAEAAASVGTSLPSNPEAARLYSEALVRLQQFDALTARDLLERAVAIEPEHALAHSTLAQTWSLLGYDERAKAAAQKAFERSGSLSREMRLLIEARLRETSKEWDRAIEIYRTLSEFFPDNLDYGLRLAEAQTSAGKGTEALATFEGLRQLPSPFSIDPRIDLGEASAAESLGDFKRAQKAAATAATKARAHGAPLLAAQARRHEGWVLQSQGQYDEAIAAANESMVAFSAAGDRNGVAQALAVSQSVLWRQGDLAAAEKMGQEILTTYREIGNKGGMASALVRTAVVCHSRGDFTDAMALYEEALRTYREIGEQDGEGLVLNNIAAILQVQGHLSRAATAYKQSLAISRQTGNRARVATVLNNIAEISETQGDLASAEIMYAESLAICREIGNQEGVGYALARLGGLLRAKDDLGGARSKYEESLAIRERLGAKADVAQTRLELAVLSLEDGRPEAAQGLAREALEQFQNEKTTDSEASACEVLARSLLAQGKPAEAQTMVERAMELMAKSQNVYVRLAVEIMTARVGALLGRSVEAVKTLKAALTEAEEKGFVGFELEIRLALGEIEIRSGNAAAGCVRLEAVEKDASERGFGLIARKVRDVLARSPKPSPR